ncbi:TonB-dependent receptor [Caulobacter sp. S45]|uniref:TonB-dependent receptor n=1 Tax=Caulobacter sp. S45 TaxID=1641861 RepID=UPI001C20451A|nr:TonB-dependent receptor [Caulobacter sp. S45]
MKASYNRRYTRVVAGQMLRGSLLVGVSTLVLATLSAPAAAQTSTPVLATATQTGAPPNDNEAAPKDSSTPPTAANSVSEVVVTGLRGSLQKNLDIKRNSTGIVDAISAEDIGKFPDSNLAAAIQRIPGVSISRGATSLGGVPTSTGDATEITVRGFGPSFNETLYDDRQISTGTSNRGFDFSAVGADFVGEVDVLKTPDASLSSGAIGATINIKYPKPFDHPGPRLVGSVSSTYSPEDGHVTPNGGVLMSDTFFDDKFGILADFAYSDHKTRSNHVNVQGWEGTQISPSQLAGAPAGASTAAGINAWYPQDYGIYQEFTNTSREDGRIVMQWRPLNNILVTVNDDYSRERVTADQNGYSAWFNAGQLTNVKQDGNGTIVNFNQPNTSTDFQSQINREVLQNNEYGLNAKWDATSNLTFVFDVDRAESWLNPDGQFSELDADVGYGSCATVCTNLNNPGISLNGGLPFPTVVGPNGNASQFIGSGVVGSHVLPITSQQNDDVVNQAKIQGTWTDDTLQIRFGAQYVSDHDHLRLYDDFTNNEWQAYSGYGPASNSPTGVALPQSLFTNSFSTSGFIPGYSGSANLPARIPKFNAYQVLQYLQSLGNPQQKNIPGFNYASVPAYSGMYQTELNPSGFQNISEDTWAGFLTFSEKMHVATMPLLVNFGLREEITRVTSAGLGQEPNSLTVQPGDHTAFLVGFGPTAPVKTSTTYSYFLPNLDMNLSLTDKLKLRFDASRTLTRPPLADLTPVTNVATSERVGSLVATGGNPTLQPYLSDNFDLGVEWYYARNSYISLDGFLKHVTNFIVAGTTKQTINGVIDPTTNAAAQFSVTTNVNGPAATVHGLEIAAQHVFGSTGFGVQANGTVVGSDKPYNPNDLSVSGFAVTGLADSANLVAFYDLHGFQARVAVNWRDGYLDHFGQQQNNSLFGTEPTFVNSNTTVDFSTSYDITSNLSIYAEALNLSDSGYSTHGRYSNQLLDVVSYGRKFTVGAHIRL